MEDIELLTTGLFEERGKERPEPGQCLPEEVQEYYRTILGSLAWPGDGLSGAPRTLGITSCDRGEGVSTIASQLAATAASLGDHQVLLVDANLLHPSVAGIFETWPVPGLADALRDGLQLPGPIQPAKVSNLCLLTAGHVNGSPGAAYDSSSLPGLVETLKAKFDLVVFDLPPIGRGGPGIRFARLLDGVLLVLEAERVGWEAARHAKQLLVRANARVLGAVLNKRLPQEFDWS